MKPEETYTIEQFINSDTDGLISFDSLCLVDYINNKKIISYNVLNDYLAELRDLMITVDLGDSYNKYTYKPKLLSYDVYGSAELYFIILYLNNMHTMKEFNLKKVKMLKKETLEFVLSSIYNAEKANIDKYNDKEEI